MWCIDRVDIESFYESSEMDVISRSVKTKRSKKAHHHLARWSARQGCAKNRRYFHSPHLIAIHFFPFHFDWYFAHFFHGAPNIHYSYLFVVFLEPIQTSSFTLFRCDRDEIVPDYTFHVSLYSALTADTLFDMYPILVYSAALFLRRYDCEPFSSTFDGLNERLMVSIGVLSGAPTWKDTEIISFSLTRWIRQMKNWNQHFLSFCSEKKPNIWCSCKTYPIVIPQSRTES